VQDADEVLLRSIAVKAVGKQRIQLDKDLKRAYAVVYEQCSQEVKDKLATTDGWEAVEAAQSLHLLINKIQKICVGFDEHEQETFNLVESLKALYLYSQEKWESVDEYARNQKSLWDTAVAFGASPGVHQKLVNDLLQRAGAAGAAADPDNPTPDELEVAQRIVSEEVQASLLLSGADKGRYEQLRKDLANDYLKGQDYYPNTMDKAVNLLGNYKVSQTYTRNRTPPRDEGGVAMLTHAGRGRGRGDGRGRGRGRGRGDAGTAATTATGGRGTNPGTGGDRRTNKSGESHCFHCGAEDHWADECPELLAEQTAQLQMNLGNEEEEGEAQYDENGVQLLNVTMLHGCGLSEDRAYLDNCSTITAFLDEKYLEGIVTVRDGMKINCNAGTMTTNRRGSYGKLKAWHLPKGIANIFSMHELEKVYRITYDSWEGYYIVHTEHGPVYFHKDENGLPFIDLTSSSENAATLLVQTVRGNYEGFTKKEVLRAKEARRAQGLIGGPSEKDFTALVSSKSIENCPVDRIDVTHAKKLFGPHLQGVKGGTVRRAADPVIESYVSVPRETILGMKVVTMSADVFFIDGIPMLLTLSRRIKFVTTEHTPSRTAKQLSKHISRVLQIYYRAGIKVRYVLMDGEFEKVRAELPNVVVNTTAAKEHVAEAERMIRVVKERCRGVICTLPFTFVPKRIKIEIVYFTTLWLNAFPVRNGISTKYSPRELILRWKMDYKKHCRVLVGTYCEVHDEPSPSNTMISRTHEGIALGPTGNLQGSVKFYSLTTGRVIKRRNFTEMPMPDSIIKKVDAIGQKENHGRQFRFTNRVNEPYEWTDEVPEDDPEFQGMLEEEEAAPFPDISAEIPGVSLERDTVADPSTAVEDEPEPEFVERAGAALDNAGIDVAARIRAGHDAPGVVGANADEVVYQVDLGQVDELFDRLGEANGVPMGHEELGGEENEVPILVDPESEDELVFEAADEVEHPDEGTEPPVPPPPAPLPNIAAQVPNRYPTRSRRSALGNQPYSNFSPQVEFLQNASCEAQLLKIAQERARRSVLGNGGAHEMEEGYINLMENACNSEQYVNLNVAGHEIDDTNHANDEHMIAQSEDEMAVFEYLMTQYNLKAGLRGFGDKGVSAAESELTQLHVMDVWEVQDPSKMSRIDKVKALSSLMFLKEKRCGKVKGRACINGAPQRAYIPKEDAASPTVSNESVFITAAIAAFENRFVRCFDVPGAFLHTDTDERVFMVLRGPLAEMLVNIAPETYKNFVTVDKKGAPVIYVKLKKALYGMLRSSLLFYRSLHCEQDDNGRGRRAEERRTWTCDPQERQGWTCDEEQVWKDYVRESTCGKADHSSLAC
jgi:hypothetical protein